MFCKQILAKFFGKKVNARATMIRGRLLDYSKRYFFVEYGVIYKKDEPQKPIDTVRRAV